MTPIERVALAICGDDNPANILSIHRTRARAAIEALREPSEKMVQAAEKALFEHMSEARDWTYAYAKEAFQSAIDAALAEGDGK